MSPEHESSHRSPSYRSTSEACTGGQTTPTLPPDTTREPTSGDSVPSLDLKVVVPAGVLVSSIIVWALVRRESFNYWSNAALHWVLVNIGWLFIIMASVFLIAMLILGFSRFGAIRLGQDDERPEFSTPSWIAMMFASGMGIGLLFYGPYEPLAHYRDPSAIPPGSQPHDMEAALSTTILHWGIHAWAMYAVVGLGIAYATFRLGKKQLISSAFIPLIGERRAEGWLGKLIDVLAIFSTVFGTSMSLAIGANQIAAGLDLSGLIAEPSLTVVLIIVAVLAVGYLASAMSGVGRGVRIVSNVNMVMAGLMALFVLLGGYTIAILDIIPASFGAYLQNFFALSTRSAASQDGTAATWMGNWTIFWWAWWISWSPFVGMFLARISRGRTIREFVIGIIIVPTTVTVLWFGIFGGTALHLEQIGESIWGDGAPEAMLFEMLHHLPMSNITSVLTMILLATFFITTADSASTVMGSMSQYGRVNPNPLITGLWGLLTTAVAVVLLTSGGEADGDLLSSVQTVIVAAGSPFLFIAGALVIAIFVAAFKDPMYVEEREARRYALTMAKERRAVLHRKAKTKAGDATADASLPDEHA